MSSLREETQARNKRREQKGTECREELAMTIVASVTRSMFGGPRSQYEEPGRRAHRHSGSIQAAIRLVCHNLIAAQI